MAGLLDSGAEIAIEIKTQEEEDQIDKDEVMKNRDFVKANWMLGPEKTQQPNSEYWRKLATVWRISPDQARRNLCANCEYFNDGPDMLAKMEQIPEDAFDKDGGGRGWCNKFDFICHNLRVCQAWERGEQPMEEGEDYSNGASYDENEVE